MRRASLSHAAPHGDPTFTPREWQVLQLLPTHLSIGAIGGSLGMRRSTAKTHVAHIYRKLGVSGRSQAVDKARLDALVPPSSSPPATRSGPPAERHA